MNRFLNFETNRWITICSPTHKKLIKQRKVNIQGDWIGEIVEQPKKRQPIDDEDKNLTMDEIYAKYNLDFEDPKSAEDEIVI